MARKAFVDEERCKECGLCITACPKNCISFSNKLNSKGFHPIQIDHSLCIGCGFCVDMCPDTAIEIWEVQEA